MKKTLRKYFCYVLSSLTLFNAAASITAYAETTYETPRIDFIETVQSDDSGYITERFVDENGNETESPEEEVSVIPTEDQLHRHLTTQETTVFALLQDIRLPQTTAGFFQQSLVLKQTV